MQIQFLAQIFSYDNKSSTSKKKKINSIVNQFPAPTSVSWISLCTVCVSVWERRGGCVSVCLNAYLHQGQAPGQGTSSLGPGCWGQERRMEGCRRRCVFTGWHSSYSPRSSLCFSDLGPHKQSSSRRPTDKNMVRCHFETSFVRKVTPVNVIYDHFHRHTLWQTGLSFASNSTLNQTRC